MCDRKPTSIVLFKGMTIIILKRVCKKNIKICLHMLAASNVIGFRCCAPYVLARRAHYHGYHIVADSLRAIRCFVLIIQSDSPDPCKF